MEILCFFAGVVFIYTQNAYILFFPMVLFVFHPKWTLIAWFLAAILWSAVHQWLVSSPFFSNEQVYKNAFLQGSVVSIPVVTATKTQFQFQVTQLDNKPLKLRLLLSCYNTCPDFHPGEVWQLHAKLIKPTNLGNPGGFDYVKWLNARHLSWTGYVLRGTSQLMTEHRDKKTILVLRQNMAETLSKMDPDLKTLGIIQALTLGITSHIDKETWDLFRRTGTTHLMVISGSHISLVAGFSYAFVKWLWCRSSRWCLLVPASRIASIAGFCMAAFYALLAGFEVPSQRALIVCFFMFMRSFCSQRFGAWQSWRYALFVVLLHEPHSVLMPGFYLSFIAVAILILVNQRFSFAGLRKTVMMQLACLVGLMPLTLFWFSYGAVNGLIANLLAIPWVSFILVPLGLFTAIFGHWLVFPWMVSILTHSIDYLFYYLYWVDSFSFVNFNVSVVHFLSPLAWMIAIGVLTFLPLPQLIPVILITILAGFFPVYEKIPSGEARVEVMDVGQGLAVVVRTAKHQLIYDTGVKFYQGSDMGKIAIIPYLNTLKFTVLDKVIISHPDLDHRGGLASLEAKYKIDELIVDDPAFYQRGLSCHSYPDWSWDGVSFHFFPITRQISSKNNSSCVLQISTPAGQILLSGDIEKQAEQYLVSTYGKQLNSSVLVVPHHGSKTSSTSIFVKTVAPKFALVSYGFDNRYHFPHQQAVHTYQQHNIPIYNTVDCGMLSVHLNAKTMSEKPSCYRVSSKGVIDNILNTMYKLART